MQTLQQIVQPEILHFNKQSSPVVINRLERFLVRRMIMLQLLRIAWKELGSPLKAIRALQQLKKKYRIIFNEHMYSKISKVDGRYFWRIAAPGFPSKALKEIQAGEINRVFPFRNNNGIRMLILGVTRKCPLRCEHCYEWHNLNQRETLSTEDLQCIVEKYQRYGTAKIIFGGGEPMVRVKAICQILEHASEISEFWMYTSGFNLGSAEAKQLKEAGLTGVMVSLDHHRPADHDTFRGYSGAYQNAINAALVCKKAGLVTGLALCATNDYCVEENIKAYMSLARRLGVSFVQFLEPKAAGRYLGKDVLLRTENKDLLQRLCREYNRSAGYRDYPIVNYPESVIRQIGCISGDRMLYINTAGEIQQCPFCESTSGNAIALPVQEVIDRLQAMPCADYVKSTF